MKRKLSFILMLVILFGCLLPTQALALDELKNTDPDKYYILLDCKNQIVTVYERDRQGEYTRIVRRMVCTSGRTEVDETNPEDVATPTPNGTWKIGARERFGKFAAFSGEYARYWTQVVDGIYFHSIMFSKRDVTKLKSGPYSTLGQNGSHGCIRLYIEDAKWLYYHACPGTRVKVSYSEPKNADLTRALKSKMSFKEYDAFQQNIYDTEPMEDRKAWTVVDRAPLRTGNGSNDQIIRRLEKGTEVTILQEGDPWVKAQYGEKEGYIKRAYVTYQQGVVESIENGPILKGTVYMYTEPDDDSTRICKVAHDTSLQILEEDNGEGWTKIRYFTDEGYIQSRYIKYDWAMPYEDAQ